MMVPPGQSRYFPAGGSMPAGQPAPMPMQPPKPPTEEELQAMIEEKVRRYGGRHKRVF